MALNGFKLDLSPLVKGVNLYDNRVQTAIAMYAGASAERLQNSAKENRPWTDRTGQARQRLRGYSAKVKNGYRVYIAHGVDYGIWLEMANERKYAVLEKTITYVGTFDIMPGFEQLLERLGGNAK